MPTTGALDGVSAPQDYLVLDSPNIAENGSYACPHDGCDGMTFDSAVECIGHDLDWHCSAGYECDECKSSFAAWPALNRHCASTGHSQTVMCREGRCPENGAMFANRAELLCHVVGSLAHQRLREPRYHTRGRQPKSYKEIVWDTESIESDQREKAVAEERKVCAVACCHKFQQDFSKTEYERHEATQAHTSAIALDTALNSSGDDNGMAEEAREAKRLAAREFRCDEGACPHFGRTFASSKSYYNHIATKVHLEGPPPKKHQDKPEAGVLRKRDSDLMDRQCMAPLCAKYLHRFSSTKCFRIHLQSAMHTRALEYEGGTVTPGSGSASGPRAGLVYGGLSIEPVTPRHASTVKLFNGTISPITPTGLFPMTPSGNDMPRPRGPLVMYDSDEIEDGDEEKKALLTENMSLKKEASELRELVDRLKADVAQKGPQDHHYHLGGGNGDDNISHAEAAIQTLQAELEETRTKVRVLEAEAADNASLRERVLVLEAELDDLIAVGFGSATKVAST